MSINRTKSKTARKKAGRQSRLAPLLLLSGGILLILGALWAADLGGIRTRFDQTANGTPRLQADQESIDLGDVKLGNPVSVSFILTNTGDGPLKFEEAPYVEVVEGCWPPTPTIGSMVLNPGESTTLYMEFLMHGDMGGKHNFRVHLPTNEPVEERTLTVLSNWVE